MRTIVYLALGVRRVNAAAAHTADLATAGDRVLLLTGGQDEWRDVTIAEGVAVHRVTARTARRMILSVAPDLLIAGDPEATPVAWAVGRRRPELPVHLEPSPDPDRRPAPADLAVISPWYPSPDNPFAGAFVRATAAAVGPSVGRVALLHTEGWYYNPTGYAGQLVAVASERQAARSGNAVVLDTAEGELTRVAVPCPAGGYYPEYARRQVEALRATLPTGRIEAPVVHAHVGFMAGEVAIRLARPDARIVVTEHATFLPRVFRQPGARRRYAAVLDRADAVLCVGRHLRDQLAEYFPDHAAKLAIVPNAIDFDRFAVRPAPPAEPLRWLYAGRLMEHKGVLTLVDAFATIAAEDPRVTLTLAGSGPSEDALDHRIASHGLSDRITRRPPVPPDDVAALMHDHDLLVHASRRETFGMTIIEAVATGTPVLVARSEGPAETLAGLEESVGQLFEPTEDPEAIAEAYRKLRDRFGALDLTGARAELLARYGREAVAARLLSVYAGGPSAPSGAPAPPPVMSRARAVLRRLPSPEPEAAALYVRHGYRAVRRRLRRLISHQ